VKVFQIALSEPPEICMEMMKGIRDLCDEYTLITKHEPEHVDFYRSIPEGKEWHWLRSDVIRFEYGSKHPDTFYFDWDVRLLRRPSPDEFSWSPGGDYWAFYTAGQPEICTQVLEEGIAWAEHEKPDWFPVKRWWLMDAIRKTEKPTLERDCMNHGNILR